MLCTRPIVYLAVCFAREYNFDLIVDHWTTVKNILKYLKRTKDMFLVYGGDKELVVNGYVDSSFELIRMTLSHQRIHIFIELWSCQLVQFQAERRGGIYV